MLDVPRLTHLQDEATRLWHSGQHPEALSDFEGLVLSNHRANFDLWHREDEARDPAASDATIALVKHAIDSLNQQRNDLVEQIDQALLASAGPQPSAAPLHSESPGLILDRLSILALKLFHTDEETRRGDGPHRIQSTERLALLSTQRDDLRVCLGELWTEVIAGRRRFKLYRQLKMYNDPEFNPVLYKRR